LPVGALGVVRPDGEVQLEGLVASLDGLVLLRRAMTGSDADELGRALAVEIRDRCGGAEILSGTAPMP
jgi:porphobilinogen deaminase